MAELKELVEQFQFSSEFWMVLLPVAMMAIDIVTGFINAWVKGEIKSSILRKGIAKKSGELVIILLGELFVIGMNLPVGICAGISIYIIVMELISIFENLDKLGVPIPKFVSKALNDTAEKINKDDEKEELQNGSEEEK